MRHYWTTIIIAILILFASFYFLVILPVNRLAEIKPISDGAGGFYPVERVGRALKGEQVYRSLGCYYCHTKLVKPHEFGTDCERGWGIRRLVARDFILDSIIMPGISRFGPDLANIAVRKPEKFAVPWRYSFTNQSERILEFEKRLLLTLYDSRMFNPRSIMPSYKALFLTETTDEYKTLFYNEEVTLPGQIKINGKLTIPSEQALNLVEYLKSLKYEQPLFEAPPPLSPSRIVRRAGEITNVLQSTLP